MDRKAIKQAIYDCTDKYELKGLLWSLMMGYYTNKAIQLDELWELLYAFASRFDELRDEDEE